MVLGCDVSSDPDGVEGEPGEAPAREADGVEPRLALPTFREVHLGVPLSTEEVASLHHQIQIDTFLSVTQSINNKI